MWKQILIGPRVLGSSMGEFYAGKWEFHADFLRVVSTWPQWALQFQGKHIWLQSEPVPLHGNPLQLIIEGLQTSQGQASAVWLDELLQFQAFPD